LEEDILPSLLLHFLLEETLLVLSPSLLFPLSLRLQLYLKREHHKPHLLSLLPPLLPLLPHPENIVLLFHLEEEVHHLVLLLVLQLLGVKTFFLLFSEL
jgi:hypothetical protein